MKHTFAAILFGSVALFAQSAVAGPAVTTEWIEARISLESCKQRVEDSLRRVGVREVDPKKFTVFAHHGENTAAIRCLPDQGIIFFVVSGPKLQNADDFLDDILAAFRKR